MKPVGTRRTMCDDVRMGSHMTFVGHREAVTALSNAFGLDVDEVISMDIHTDANGIVVRCEVAGPVDADALHDFATIVQRGRVVWDEPDDLRPVLGDRVRMVGWGKLRPAETVIYVGQKVIVTRTESGEESAYQIDGPDWMFAS